MNEDLHTPNVRAAELHERHHGITDTPADYGIRPEDVLFRMAHGEHPDCCWACIAIKEARWTA